MREDFYLLKRIDLILKYYFTGSKKCLDNSDVQSKHANIVMHMILF